MAGKDEICKPVSHIFLCALSSAGGFVTATSYVEVEFPAWKVLCSAHCITNEKQALRTFTFFYLWTYLRRHWSVAHSHSQLSHSKYQTPAPAEVSAGPHPSHGWRIPSCLVTASFFCEGKMQRRVSSRWQGPQQVWTHGMIFGAWCKKNKDWSVWNRTFLLLDVQIRSISSVVILD